MAEQSAGFSKTPMSFDLMRTIVSPVEGFAKHRFGKIKRCCALLRKLIADLRPAHIMFRGVAVLHRNGSPADRKRA
jgi:hypothetical protein